MGYIRSLRKCAGIQKISETAPVFRLKATEPNPAFSYPEILGVAPFHARKCRGRLMDKLAREPRKAKAFIQREDVDMMNPRIRWLLLADKLEGKTAKADVNDSTDLIQLSVKGGEGSFSRFEPGGFPLIVSRCRQIDAPPSAPDCLRLDFLQRLRAL
jgi:hypothetical protein